MKSTIKTLGVLLAAGAFTVATLPAATPTPTPAPAAAAKPAATTPPPAMKLDELLPDTALVKGKGFEIKRSVYDKVLNSVKGNAAARGQEIPPAQLAVIERQLLDHLIQIQLLEMKASDADKAKGKEEAAHRLDLIKKQEGSEEALNMKLKAVGMTLEELQSRLTEDATAEAVLRAKVTVTDEQVKKFYDENPAKFEQPEMVRASHILIGTMDPATHAELPEDQKKAKLKQAQALLKRARDGEDFTKLAKEFSEDPGVKQNDGEYKFPRGQMMPEFEAAAFSLKTNQISDIVTTSYGYHIIKLSEKIPASKVDFAKVSPEIRTYLEKLEMDKIMPPMYVQMKKDMNVQIMDEHLKALENAADVEAAKPPMTTPETAPKAAVK
ncbi:MAG: Peptidylprolyl isomerase [Pedosphaera sp.]|nr:Peptidylprolyl isomerase [Pedosphaera sp.]